MVYFFKTPDDKIIALEAIKNLTSEDFLRIEWLFNGATRYKDDKLCGFFVGPRREMITPWSTCAVEIVSNMGIEGVSRIEEFSIVENEHCDYDKMLERVYTVMGQDIFYIDKKPDPVIFIDNIKKYNDIEGLALNVDEIAYLEALSSKIGRKLTDSEVFGFSQVNSEHCRHKIFNGTFIIDGKQMPDSLFALIKKTSKVNPNRIVSAYKDNVTFILGPKIEQFAPENQDKPDYFKVKDVDAVISLKAETHNFPTTVEPFNGAATGTGGEIRDRMAGGKGSIPIAGTAVYMTSYPRLEQSRKWEGVTEQRNWLYQTPEEILIKASNGASDFGNKFGQPLICGSLLTFEHFEKGVKYGFDKVIMLAGGVGFGKKIDALKDIPQEGDVIVVLGGDNYRIGMGGGAVSSVATGEYGNAIELNAVQRANPEMQKRVFNAVRAMVESDINPVVSIHDHGAGGHLNCLSELVEEMGGSIDINKLPVGDPTLSDREIAGNESQERMGLVIDKEDAGILDRIAQRERAPMYEAGVITGDKRFVLANSKTGINPIDLDIKDMIGSTPKTVMFDEFVNANFDDVLYEQQKWEEYLNELLQLESVACKDWLTNKVDRSVTGKIAMQQCTGALQLPLNNLGVVALDYKGVKGIATSIGDAPVAALVDPEAGSRLAVAEALTNIVWAEITDGIRGISLSANWMWPCKNKGENARLYKAVNALSDFVCQLGINVPTGKDSLSMTQKYPDGDSVISPGTVIVSSVAPVEDIKKTVTPVVKCNSDTVLIYIDFSKSERFLGGSAFGQIVNKVGKTSVDVSDSEYFIKCFETLQQLVAQKRILAGHDISSGGLITTLLEMLFADNQTGMCVDLTGVGNDMVKVLFAENPGVVIQVLPDVKDYLSVAGIDFIQLGKVLTERKFELVFEGKSNFLDVNKLRDIWFKTSYLFDKKQCGADLALLRFENYKKFDLNYKFPENFLGSFISYGLDGGRKNVSGIKAAIIREKGSNGDREMAYCMYLAGFDVKDVHTTDLIEGRETLSDVNLIVFVGGFANSDVLGSAKGWAGALMYNPKAKIAIDSFYARKDTLSLGVCNGCQLMMEMGLVCGEHSEKTRMLHNESHKFESNFIMLDILDNNSVMMHTLAGSRLGIWVAHGEGNFSFPLDESQYNIPAKYSGSVYPANPNGSDYNAAALCSSDGRHLVIMPHFERSFLPWQWPYYPENRKNDEVTPWIEAFVNAKNWILNKKSV